jgi:hypothetical protein
VSRRDRCTVPGAEQDHAILRVELRCVRWLAGVGGFGLPWFNSRRLCPLQSNCYPAIYFIETGSLRLERRTFRRLRELKVSAPVIVIAAHGDIPLAMEAMRIGATDFLEKPFED